MKNKTLFFSISFNLLIIGGGLVFGVVYWDKLKGRLGIAEQKVVIMLGDSLTEGGNWKMLLERNDVENSGVTGFTTSHFEWMLKDKVLKYDPKICYIEGGVNDINVGIPYQRTVRNINNIIDTLQKNNIKPIMQSVIYTTDRIRNTKIDSLNFLYRKICREKNIQYLDLNLKLSKNGMLLKEYSTDGIHLKESAYPIWADLIKNSLLLNKL